MSLQKTLDYIPKSIFTIADAKRGDIGNTSLMYAKTFLNTYKFDSVTVAPYMGSDSVKPFLEVPNKWAILLGLTSNVGASDFQFSDINGEALFEQVISKSKTWGDETNMMYVIGATKAEHFIKVRKLVPDHFLLVPGVGAQGGSLEAVCENGLNDDIGLLINSSRGILYASNGEDFEQAARTETIKIQTEMKTILANNKLI